MTARLVINFGALGAKVASATGKVHCVITQERFDIFAYLLAELSVKLGALAHALNIEAVLNINNSLI